jgi:hypothetical protein
MSQSFRGITRQTGMSDVITLSAIQQSFAAFAEANGTTVDLALADDAMMIARCVLPTPFEVRPGDTMKGGVAVRGTLEEVEVRPYLFRLVCTNGAIMMKSAAGSTVATAVCTESWLQDALAAAGSREAIEASVSQVRTFANSTFDRAFMFATFMRRMRGIDQGTLLEIVRRMTGEGSTGYALMNAITSVARDTPDPQTRWRLEAAGGAIPALLLSGPSPRDGHDALELATLDRDLQLA